MTSPFEPDTAAPVATAPTFRPPTVAAPPMVSAQPSAAAPLTAMPPTVGPPTMYPHGQPAAGHMRVPTWVKVVAVLVSLVKAVPLVLTVVLALALSNFFSGVDNYESAVAVVGLSLVIFIAVPGLFLFLQIYGALASKRTLLLVIAGLLSGIDAFALLAVLGGLEPGVGFTWLGLMVGITACQASIFLGALKAR